VRHRIAKNHGVSNLPHDSSHHVSSFWFGLDPNDRLLAEHLSNNDLVDVFNRLFIDTEAAARLEHAPFSETTTTGSKSCQRNI